ncbi:MAG: N-acetyl-gamma-glutamyl-phosphate reductase [Spirochaetaceae bacterium]|jgi:N-acetyl-gamma-glutamyl-phosphate reductase|nr:N-acetyl-gamma-glutamyl-phosphate reductase [Spirochaetaceae bacterium]
MIAAVIGATGYAGSELVRLLSGHPRVRSLLAASASATGTRLDAVYPSFTKAVPLTLTDVDGVFAKADVVFSARPNGHAGALAQSAAQRSIPFIDLSADFRFGSDAETYTAWYGLPCTGGALHEAAVYGLPELNREKIAALGREKAYAPVIIGNPGCYPTAASLAAFPALRRGLAGGGLVIANAVSGISGAGREPGRAYHFPECSDSCTPYKTGAHRHTPEISRNFFYMEKTPPPRPRPLIFTPHLAPMNRGILATVYIPLGDAEKRAPCPAAPRPPTREITERAEAYRQVYRDFYENEPFVRVLPEGIFPATGRVRGSNFCDISVSIDQNGETLIVCAAIDNMVKGAAGQALQNMNIIFGFDEREGLVMIPSAF